MYRAMMVAVLLAAGATSADAQSSLPVPVPPPPPAASQHTQDIITVWRQLVDEANSRLVDALGRNAALTREVGALQKQLDSYRKKPLAPGEPDKK